MRKSAVLFSMLAVMPVFAHADYKYADNCIDCGYETTSSVKTHSYKTSAGKKSGYKNVINNNFYYNQQPIRSNYYSGDKVQSNRARYNYNMNNYQEVSAIERTDVKKQSYSNSKRKYFLAHPFFQPDEGRFGSVTDVFYAKNNFDFSILNGNVWDIDPSSGNNGSLIGVLESVDLDGTQESSQFGVKEDFSYGITEKLALVGMLQYDNTKVSFKNWSSGEPSDSVSDSGINVFGMGFQYRFADDEEWIAMLSGHFQHQKDIANTFIAEIKGGYKISRTTLYGLGRLWYSDLTQGDTYGSFVKDSNGDWLMLSYKTNVDNILYAEIGAGVFSVLNKYITLNGELLFGDYDWHNQLTLKGAIGFQPEDNFALNLYASTALYDSAKDKTLKYMNYDINPDLSDFPTSVQGTNLVYTTGDYEIKNYKEWKIGVQAIFYF